MILNISPSFLDGAAEIYSISWITSHKDVCSDSFLIEHTPSFMKRKIEREIESGWEYYISLSPSPSGIVSIKGNEISSLYVLPSMERKGIGGELLSFAEEKTGPECFLWCRKENTKAMIFYLNRGYIIEEEKVINAAMTEVKLIKFQSPREEKNSSTSIL